MTPAVSIIMPVYNTEKYLREALDTVLAQTMTDIEVLCVDDGSTDSSLEILHEYAAKDPRVTVYTQDHQFAGAARNLGIKHAAGKYLLFLDSDDIFYTEMVEKAYKRAEETNADICEFSGEYYDEDTGKRHPGSDICRADLCPETVFSAKDHPNEIFAIGSAYPWNKLFRREFIIAEGIEFQTVRSSNDLAFVLTAFACAERITLLNEVLCSYRIHTGSLQHTQGKDPLAFYAALAELRERLTARGLYEPLKYSFAVFTAASCVSVLYMMNTISGFLTAYNCIQEKAIPEFGLDDLPEWADRLFPYWEPAVDIPQIKKFSPGTYAALHWPKLRAEHGFSSKTEYDRFVIDILEENSRIIGENKKKHNEEIQTIMNSPSVKIGRAVTAPLRKIRDLLRKS